MSNVQVLKRTLAFIFILMACFSLTRAQFIYMNPDMFKAVSFGDYLQSFLLGLRFDLAAVLFGNCLLLLWVAVLGWSFGPVSYWAFRIYVTLINGAFLGLNVLDSEFYKFNGKRFSQEFLLNADDFKRHTLSAFLTYWKLFLIFLFFTWFSYWLFGKLAKKQDAETRFSKHSTSALRKSILKRAAVAVCVLALLVVGIRGGVQLKPLNPINAYAQGSRELGALVLNSPYAFLRGKVTDLSDAPTFYETLNEARSVVQKFRGHFDGEKFKTIKNVFVIVVESLSTEYTGLVDGQTSYTPFIDMIGHQGLVFVNNFANGRRSIEGMPSIFCSLPSLVPQPIITSNLNQNELICLPHILGENFETSFFHGAHNGSFHMDSFSKRAGFQKFYGFDEYPNPEDSDGHWGILDEPMLQFAAEEVSKSSKPFVAGVFTLSSHHPYFIPPQYRGKFGKGPLEIHESMGYADYAIEQFFKTAKTKPWYKDTLFVITGDHTQKSVDPKYAVLAGNYKVPLIFYSENPEFQNWENRFHDQLEGRVTQHADIYPSVLMALGLPLNKNFPPFGESVFNARSHGLAVNFDGFQYWLAYNGDRDEGPVKVVTLNARDKSLGGDIEEPETSVLKALVTFFNLGMRHNNLYQ